MARSFHYNTGTERKRVARIEAWIAGEYQRLLGEQMALKDLRKKWAGGDEETHQRSMGWARRQEELEANGS